MALFQLPNMIGLLEFIQMFLTVCKFQWSFCIQYYPNWNEAVWNSPKSNKAVWSYSKLEEKVPLGPNLNGAIAIWSELIYSVGIHPNFSNLWKHF